MAVCVCCKNAMSLGLKSWHTQCPACAYEASSLDVAINVGGVRERINETARGDALRDVRAANFEQLLDLIRKLLPTATNGAKRRHLLDVGAGHGWFVQAAATENDVTGIEPDEGARAHAATSGTQLVAGLFPQCLAADELFDVITFNDSLEHMPDAGWALRAAYDHLAPGGLVVVNLPDSRGVFYKASRLLARIGWSGPFDRMWQLGLPSPHLHYFAPDNLSALARECRLELAGQQSLESIRVKGLYARISYARPGATLSSMLMYVALLPMVLFMRVAPSDIMVLVFRRAK